MGAQHRYTSILASDFIVTQRGHSIDQVRLVGCVADRLSTRPLAASVVMRNADDKHIESHAEKKKNIKVAATAAGCRQIKKFLLGLFCMVRWVAF